MHISTDNGNLACKWNLAGRIFDTCSCADLHCSGIDIKVWNFYKLENAQRQCEMKRCILKNCVAKTKKKADEPAAGNRGSFSSVTRTPRLCGDSG